MSHWIKVSFCVSLLALVSCAPKLTEGKDKLPRIKEKQLLSALDSLAIIQPDHFYSKIATKFKDTTRSLSFKTSLRITTDSAVNVMITYASIPVVTSLITKDSIIVVNKKDKCFIAEGLDYIRENFEVDFSLKNIEEVFMGKPLAYDIDQKYFQFHDPYNYTVSSHRKSKFKRTNQRGEVADDVLIKYHLTDKIDQLRGMEIYSPEDSVAIKIDYIERELIDGFNVPKLVNIHVNSPKNNMLIEMVYDKTEVNVPKEMILVIPEKYEKCEN